MRWYHYILLFLLVSVCMRIYYLLFLKKKIVIEEGFESLESCLSQGYPTRFCKRVPIQSWLSC